LPASGEASVRPAPASCRIRPMPTPRRSLPDPRPAFAGRCPRRQVRYASYSRPFIPARPFLDPGEMLVIIEAIRQIRARLAQIRRRLAVILCDQALQPFIGVARQILG